ncbi:UNVERIFIED_CONTAM: protein NUCLEAR FUSION defective [Sesamum radiatum]|uniref:Protein NUCLEAR FUSION defective n=1 Tax=Sesamum radiatum TaxID=300843 RepID=A0AAW2JSJ8_SESRA
MANNFLQAPTKHIAHIKFKYTLSRYVFLLCLLAGCSICWFNTVCFVLCIKNFPSNRPLALSLTVSFNGVSAALYNLAVNSLNPSTSAAYLLLNALVPLFTSIAALVPILRQPPVDPPDPEVVKRIPGVVYARNWFRRTVYSSIRLDGSGFILVDAEDLELHKELLSRDSLANGLPNSSNIEGSPHGANECCSCAAVIEKDQLVMLGQEHTAKMLGRSLDFWLILSAYFCGGTIGLVQNSILPGQDGLPLHSCLHQSPSLFLSHSEVTHLLELHSGSAPGFIFAAAVSITSELFGPESAGVNHNILITNIPIGSLIYGFLAALVYDSNAVSGVGLLANSVVCMGRKCYFWTFVWWGCISLLGLASSVLLFIRTKPAYHRF